MKPSTNRASRRLVPRRLSFALAIFLTLVVVSSCNQTSTSAGLADAQITAMLQEGGSPEQVLQALNALQLRVKEGKPITPWVPLVVNLSTSSNFAVRHEVVDFMAIAPKQREFQMALHRVLESDTLPIRNAAAISLAAFGDSYGHELIAHMLQPMVVMSPKPGHVKTVAKTGRSVEHGALILQIQGMGTDTPIFAPIGGTPRLEVETGDIVSGGSRLAVIAPDPDQLMVALKALQNVGKSGDVVVVAELEKNQDYPASVREQAKLTAQQINERSR